MSERFDQSKVVEASHETHAQKAQRALLELLLKTPVAEGEEQEATEETREELRKTFERFPELIDEFISIYQAELKQAGIEPGDIQLFMVGGRVSGKPLKASSDIDLLWGFDKPISPYANKDSHLDISTWIALRQKVLFEKFTKVCEKFNIPNHHRHPGRFQFFNWGGEKSIQEMEESLKDGEKLLRIR